MPIDKTKIEELNTLLQNPDRTAVQTQIEQAIKDLGLDTDINKPLDKKTTLAHFAAKHNMPDVINYLITKSADFSLKDSAKPDHTPAYYAARENNKNVIRALVRARADFSDPTIQKQLNKHSALDFLHECEDAQAIESRPAVFFQNSPLPIIDRFLRRGLHNINAKDDNGWTVARHMAEYGREDILNHLIEKGMDLGIAGKDGKTVFDILNVRNPELAERIQKNFEKKRAEDALTKVDWTTVSLDEIKKLVDKGADLRKVMTTVPLTHLALTNNHPEILDYLVNQDIDLNAKDASGKTIAHIAAEKGYKGVLLNLVEKSFQKDGVNWQIRASGKSPMDAIADPILKKEIEDNLNATESLLNLTSSHFSPQPTWGNITQEQITELLNMGARVNAQDKNGKNAIMMAVQANNLDALKTLVDNNALLDKKDNLGKTAAHHAAESAVENSDTEILDYLADKHIDFNTKNNRGYTPAYLAMMKAASKMRHGKMAPEQMQAVAESLINAGADFEKEDNSGKTVMDYIPEGPEKENIKEAFERKKEENESSEIDPNLLNNPLKQGEDEEESGTPQQEEEKSDNSKVAEDVAHALKDATKAFVKNVFEADFKTAEDFATAFLFNMLAFPLEAIHGYLDPSGDPQLSELKAIKELLKQQMAANAQNGGNEGNAPLRLPPLTEQQKNLISLKELMMTADPEAFEQLNNAVGKLSPEDLGHLTVEQMQERAQKMQQFLQANPSLQQRFKDAFTNVIKLPQGKEIFEKCFQGYSGEITPDQVIAVLIGEKQKGKRQENSGNRNENEGDNPTVNTLLDVIKQHSDKVSETFMQMSKDLSASTQAQAKATKEQAQAQAELAKSLTTVAETQAKANEETAKANGKTAEANKTTAEANGKNTEANKEVTKANADTFVKMAEVFAKAQEGTTKGQAEQFSGVLKEALKTSESIIKENGTLFKDSIDKINSSNSETQKMVADSFKETIKVLTDQKGKNNTSAQAMLKTFAGILTEKDKEETKRRLNDLNGESKKLKIEKEAELRIAQEETKRKEIEEKYRKQQKEINAKKAVEIAKQKDFEVKVTQYKRDNDPIRGNSPTSEKKEESLPFDLPEGLSKENKQKIKKAYNNILNKEESVEKKAQKIADFLNKTDDLQDKFQKIATAYTLISKHGDLLDKIRVTKKGEIHKQDLKKLESNKLNADTVKLAKGLKKRLAEGSKAGANLGKGNDGRS